MADIDRRAFIAGASTFLLAPLVVRAQQAARVPRIGLLSPFTSSDTAVWHQAFRQGLDALGWVEGKNIGIESRYADGRIDRLPDLAADLIRLKVDVIVTAVMVDALAARNATTTIPIVMASPSDPVSAGLVQSLARPGGNVTGLSQMGIDLTGKRLELLKEFVPTLSHLAVLRNPLDPGSTLGWKEIQLPAQKLRIQLHSLEVRNADEFTKVFNDTTWPRADALFVMPTTLFVTNLKRIADLAAKSRLPSIFNLREFAEAGGLVTYGPDRSDLFRRAARYVDKLLRGEKPANLPVEQPTKFELIINGKTAKALGLTIPQSLLIMADKVIE